MRAKKWGYLRSPMPAEMVDDRDAQGNLLRRKTDVLDQGHTVARITTIRDAEGYTTTTCVIFNPTGVERTWHLAEVLEEHEVMGQHGRCVRDTIVCINSMV